MINKINLYLLRNIVPIVFLMVAFFSLFSYYHDRGYKFYQYSKIDGQIFVIKSIKKPIFSNRYTIETMDGVTIQVEKGNLMLFNEK